MRHMWRRGRKDRGHKDRGRKDRGATLVEYALGVAVVCAASIGAIQFMQDETSDDFNDRADRAGAPDLEEAVDGGTTGGSTTGGSDGSDGGPAPTEVFFAGFSDASASGNPSKWTAKITLKVVDGGGADIDGATVVGTWTYGTTTQTVTCNQTSNKGECKFQITDLPASASEVTFTLTEISGGVPEVEYNGGPVTSDPILKPTGGPN